MTRRKRKKEPPDPKLPPFDSPLDRSSSVDLASYLLNSRFRFQPFHFPCSILDYGFSAVPNSSQVHFLLQPVVGLQRRICWFRIHRLSSTIHMEFCIQTSSVCDGPNCLPSPASLCLNLPSCSYPFLFPSRSGHHPVATSSGQLGRSHLSVWRVMVLIKPNFGAVELCLEESNSLLALVIRSV